MKYNSPSGRRNRGRTLKRLLDTWDRNGSTRGLTPWQINYGGGGGGGDGGDDDDGDDGDDISVHISLVW